MSAPLFFFTAEDPREIPKGSRDPLRFQPEWAEVARKMIPYLTTVTPSYRGFLTRFLFHGLLEDIAPALANASADDQWPAFCKFEQLCAHVRFDIEPTTPNFPGISGVPKQLKNGVLKVGAESSFWLVRSQKNTGYWGYYHQASQGSGLIRKNKAPAPGYQLTENALALYRASEARSIVMHSEEGFSRVFKEKTPKIDLSEFGPLASLFAAKPLNYGGAWGDFWLENLLIRRDEVEKSFSCPLPSAFADEIRNAWDENPERSVGQMWERLALSNTDVVASFASDVMACEAVIGLCEWVFDVCRMRFESGGGLEHAAEWAYKNGYNADWLNRLQNLRAPYSQALTAFRAVALQRTNSFEDLARLLLDRHKSVMTKRKGATWVELLDGDALNIRDPSDEPWMLDLERSPSGVRWRYDYLLGSWLKIGTEIGYLRESIDG